MQSKVSITGIRVPRRTYKRVTTRNDCNPTRRIVQFELRLFSKRKNKNKKQNKKKKGERQNTGYQRYFIIPSDYIMYKRDVRSKRKGGEKGFPCPSSRVDELLSVSLIHTLVWLVRFSTTCFECLRVDRFVASYP